MVRVDVCVKMVESFDLVKIEGSYLLVQGFIESSKGVDLSDLVVPNVSLPVIHDL